jgi:hypothetical protein
MDTAARVFGGHDHHYHLGKRDDDLKKRPGSAKTWMLPLHVRRRRVVMGVLGVLLIWLFIHNIPTDLGSVDQRMGRPLRPGHKVGSLEFGYRPPARPAQPVHDPHASASNKEPVGPAPKSPDTYQQEDHYYAGPLRYYRLARSIQAIGHTMGHRTDNKNILFAAASLKSAANLLPLACAMARLDRNYVHFALLGRESMSLEQVLQINRVHGESCGIFFHDGRCDYSEYSTDARAEASVVGALGHLYSYMHPQVAIIDDSSVEHAFFVRAMRSKLAHLNTPLLEIPSAKYEDFLWLTRLDSGALASWHRPSITILIHAQPRSSGSLLRLLHSIQTADYSGLSYPDITIDLPADVESFARDYLRDFEWPPHQDPTGPRQRKLKLHHRISTTKATTEANALRFLESFYPVDPSHSHVLLLSTQTELSPLYYQYLMYHVLQHRYSAYGSDDGDNLFGIVLANPDTYLNGTTPFRHLTMSDTGKMTKDMEDLTVPFLWQAPNADAALVFGDVWAEVHDYLKSRLRAVHDTSSVHHAPSQHAKLISDNQPGWLEYMLELMRARGWRNLYPARLDAGAWATVHRDLFQKPEEYMTNTRPKHPDVPEDATRKGQESLEEPFLRAESAATQTSRHQEHVAQQERSTLQHSQPLHALLPYESTLSDIGSLPALEYTGKIVAEREEFARLAAEFRPSLREQIGGCSAAEAIRDRKYDYASHTTNDLFCFVDQADVLLEEDAAEKTAKAILPENNVQLETSPAEQVAPVKEESRLLDSATRQKSAYFKAEQPV